MNVHEIKTNEEVEIIATWNEGSFVELENIGVTSRTDCASYRRFMADPYLNFFKDGISIDITFVNGKYEVEYLVIKTISLQKTNIYREKEIKDDYRAAKVCALQWIELYNNHLFIPIVIDALIVDFPVLQSDKECLSDVANERQGIWIERTSIDQRFVQSECVAAYNNTVIRDAFSLDLSGIYVELIRRHETDYEAVCRFVCLHDQDKSKSIVISSPSYGTTKERCLRWILYAKTTLA